MPRLPPSSLPPSSLPPAIPQPGATGGGGRKGVLIGVAVTAAAALVAGGGYLAMWGGDSGSSAGAQHSSLSASSSSANEAQLVATAVSKVAADPAGALASDARDLVPEPGKALPPGTKLTPEVASWAPDGTGSGGTMAVDVTYPGRSPVTYLAVMVKEGDSWKVLATVEVPR